MAQNTFQSEIRHSEVQQLLEKAAKQSYGKYLQKLNITKLRGLEKQLISFEFPVTALIAPNGGGKTTILGAAACAYKSVKPRQFFAKSGKLDDSMQNWRFECELVDRGINPKESFRRTVSFLNTKWSRDQIERDVVVFGVARTVPANERAELRKCATAAFEVKPESVVKLTEPVATAVQRILGKSVANYTHMQIDTRGRVTLLSGQTELGVSYSEFHFGAGESSIIRMIMRIESLQDNSLILIEEIENGLHPVATIRMVEYLIDVALRKSAQAIFTTHSNDALRPLPDKAIWASVRNRIFQGKLSIESLRAITGEIDAALAVFTEDEFSAAWMQTIVRHAGLQIELIEVHGMAGDGIAVEVNKHHNMDPTRKFPSLCFIDGDSRQLENSKENVFRLPGQSPEQFIFNAVKDRLSNCKGRLAVALHRKYEDEDLVEKVITEVSQTNRDSHLLYSQVGKRLGLIPSTTVRDGFLSIWVQEYPDAARLILTPIQEALSPVKINAEGVVENRKPEPPTKMQDDLFGQ
ncbi:ATP-dependent nuclease [Nevskia soli]|uniref:ATP-dependent nuclease n=1 Tax=Nevskia soli TaxID=418856 RepID=UPI0009FD0F84|nr:AAA family ATPase [Nevskia soli]